MRDPLPDLNEKIEALAERLQRLGSDPTSDPDSAQELLEALGRAERERRRLLRERLARPSGPSPEPGPESHNGMPRDGRARPPAEVVMPVRERVLAGLELLGVPARGPLLSIAAAARTGLPIESRQLASLRRSELASWRSAPDRRPAYVVPALHDRRFEPLRGTVASSVWEPWRRVVGPLSPRADHLRSAIRVAEQVTWARQHSEEIGARLERLLWRLARSVPGALDGTEFDVERVIAAAQAELSVVEGEDRAHREAAAARLDRLPAEQRLFGAGLRVVGGEASGR